MRPLDILYSFRRCPYAIRARMALLVSGVPFAIHEVDLRHKPAHFLAASPKGTVPVLVLTNGQVVDESLDIMRWALRQNDPEDWLAGDDPALIERFDDGFKHHLDLYKYAANDSDERIDNRNMCMRILNDLELRLTISPHLSREARSFADIAIMPFVRQCAAVDRAWFDAQPVPRVRHWLVMQTTSSLFEHAMKRSIVLDR